MTFNKSREAKLRRKALQKGFRLVKARASSDKSRGYSLVDQTNNLLIFGHTQGQPFGATIVQTELFLRQASTS